jgi:UDPglucose 6-dehydrogenase
MRNAYEVATGTDALVIATEWKEFRSPDFDRLKSNLASGVIFDGHNLYDPAILQRIGFTYYAIGHGQSLSSSQ